MNRCRFDRPIRRKDRLVAGLAVQGQLVHQERQMGRQMALVLLAGPERRQRCRQWGLGRLRQKDRPEQLALGQGRRGLVERQLRMNRQKPPKPGLLAFVVAQLGHPMGLLVRLGLELLDFLQNKFKNQSKTLILPAKDSHCGCAA